MPAISALRKLTHTYHKLKAILSYIGDSDRRRKRKRRRRKKRWREGRKERRREGGRDIRKSNQFLEY